jgi:hypothetical protein
MLYHGNAGEGKAGILHAGVAQADTLTGVCELCRLYALYNIY